MQKGQGLIFVIVGILVAAIIAGGAYYLGRSTSPQPSATPNIISQTPQPSPSPDETVYTESDRSANWKIYTDSKNGFTLKYPVDNKVSSQQLFAMLSMTPSDGISIAPPSQPPYNKWYDLDIVVRNNPQNLSEKILIDNYIAAAMKNCSPPGCSVQKTIQDSLKEYHNGVINGYIFHIGAETDSAMVVQSKNRKVYIFRLSGDSGNLPDQWLDTLNQILSTFKFL